MLAPASLQKFANKWFALTAVILVCYITGGSTTPTCRETYIEKTLNETPGPSPSPVEVIDLTTICPNIATYKVTLEGDDSKFTFTVTKLTCTDPDAEARLSTNASVYANPWTIVLRIVDPIDGNYTTLTVLVRLNSLNDFPATTTDLDGTKDIPENTAVGTIVKSCSLQPDGDYPGSGQDIPYIKIIKGNDDNKFAVDKETCEIRLIDTLNANTESSYTLNFSVNNADNDPKATTTHSVTFTVTPVYTYPPKCTPYTIIRGVPEDAANGTILAMLNCTNFDGSGSVDFYRDAPSSIPELNVNQAGHIVVGSTLQWKNAPANNTKQITVIVVPKGLQGPKLRLTAYIKIKDVDNNIPQLTLSVYSKSISSTTLVGTSVLTLAATDADAPNTYNSKITYGFENPCTPDLLYLDGNTGSIYVKANLSPVPVTITCKVYAYSSNKTSDKTSADVSITVTDGINKAPVLSQPAFVGNISENSMMGTYVLSVNATDPDGGILTYSFPPGTNWPFGINSVSGAMTVTSGVDYELTDFYSGTVTVTDNGVPPLATIAYIFVYIRPINEDRPTFQPTKDVNINKYAKPGTIMQLTVQDKDSGPDGKVECSLNDPSLPFILDKQRCTLLLGIGLDKGTSPFYDVVITATDKSETNVMSGTTTVRVNVNNNKNNDPQCSPVAPILVTPNSPQKGDPIGYLQCTDADPNTILRYDIIGGDIYKLFDVTFNGTIRLATTPIAGVYIVLFRVSDQGTPARTAVVAVQINVETILMINLPASISVYENSNDFDVIFTVIANGSYEQVEFKITGGNTLGLFNINQMTGDIKLTRTLDREANAFHDLEIVCSSPDGQSVKNNLHINVNDTNDQYPIFGSSVNYIKIAESQSVPNPIATFGATDLDIQQNAQIDYMIISGDPVNTFSYDKSGQLWLMQKLDFGTKPFYALVLLARDRGNPSLNTTMIVNIEVTDVSDNNLVIVSSGGRVPLTLPENTAIGSAVVKIVLQNNDTSLDVTFTITSGNGGNNFTIDPTTGVMYLIYALDREFADFMNIIVQVNKNGKINSTIVAINITDSNDNSPFCNPSNNVFRVPHGTMAGSSIGTLTVTDPDSGKNSELTLSIISGDPKGEFSFNGKTLMSEAFLDAKVQNIFMLTVLIIDHGTPSLNSTAYVTVIILPEFHTPLFSPKVFNIPVEENRLPGSLLYNADATFNRATEATSTNPGDLVYTMSSGDRTQFYLESDIGELQLISPLNYSKNTVFTVIITASNKYNLSLNDNSTVTIIVTQVNRWSPVCSSYISVWNVDENTAPRTDVGRVTATDNDPGEFGVLKYNVEPNNNFKVDPTSGVVSLISVLDYSIAKSYDLLVTVTDNAGVNSRIAYCLVLINVIDMNNHRPTFTNDPYEVTVPENVPVGTILLVLYAEDLDSGVNGTVMYSILSGNLKGVFSLDSSTGVLSLSASLDFETVQPYILIVEGKDGGKPPLSNTTMINIQVTDQNDHIPDFRTPRIEITIRSDTPTSTPIYTFNATDGDAGTNGIINYFIQSGNGDQLFTINIYTGVLKTAVSVASAKKRLQQLTVAAIDQGKSPLTGTVIIAITIQPVPSPEAANFAFSVSENRAVGTQVGTIINDPTLGITGYKIRGGNYGNAFEVLINGTIITKIVLDRENYAYYQLMISVVFGTTSSDITVNIAVLDVNDCAPVIVKSVLNVQVVENLAPDYVVGEFTVTDADEKGRNSEYDLYIYPATPPAITYFSIDTPTGALKLIRPISYEMLSSLEFYVEARDRGTPRLSSFAKVNVAVIDVNETKVYNYFESASFITCDFPDDAIYEEAVWQLKASDVGVTTLSGDTVSFTIVGRESIFSVHPSTGYLQIFKQSFITRATRYFQWIIVSIKSGGVLINHALMVRLDTFNKQENLITVAVSTDLGDLRSNLAAVQANLQKLFKSPATAVIWSTRSSTSSTTRRRLLASGSEALVLVENDKAANDISNIDATKTFMTSNDAMKVLQKSSDGTPVASLASSTPPVTSVKPYSATDDSLDPAYIALIVVGSIVLLALIIAIIVLIIYCCFYRKAKDHDKKKLVKKKNQSQQTFGNIQQSDIISRPVVNKSYPDDPDSDGMPVRPTTAMFISSSNTPIKASDSGPKKNSSTMLESLEERNEENINANSSVA